VTPIVLPQLGLRREEKWAPKPGDGIGEDDGRDAMVDELIDSLPPEVFVEEVATHSSSPVAPVDTWNPVFTLEAAKAKLGRAIEEALSNELKGSLREVRRYRPSASIESDQRKSTENSSGDEPLEEEIDVDAE
jgi:hypothetical protein